MQFIFADELLQCTKSIIALLKKWCNIAVVMNLLVQYINEQIIIVNDFLGYTAWLMVFVFNVGWYLLDVPLVRCLKFGSLLPTA